MEQAGELAVRTRERATRRKRDGGVSKGARAGELAAETRGAGDEGVAWSRRAPEGPAQENLGSPQKRSSGGQGSGPR